MKTLSILRDTDALATVVATGRRIQRELGAIIAARGLPCSFTGVPSMFSVVFSETVPVEYRGWAQMDNALYDAVAAGMWERGAMPEPDSREPWFICEAHARNDLVDRVVSAFSDSLDAALEARARG